MRESWAFCVEHARHSEHSEVGTDCGWLDAVVRKAKDHEDVENREEGKSGGDVQSPCTLCFAVLECAV